MECELVPWMLNEDTFGGMTAEAGADHDPGEMVQAGGSVWLCSQEELVSNSTSATYCLWSLGQVT